MNKEKIRLTLGVPSHGWLPATLSIGGFSVDMDVSDVPMDPLSQLLDAIHMQLNRCGIEVWLHLEPAGYYLVFSAPEGDIYRLSVQFEDGTSASERKELCQTSGTFDKVVLPFWRAIREFETHGYREPAWPPLPVARINEVKSLIDARKEEANKIIQGDLD